MRRLKVLHVIPSVGPLRGGPSVTIRTLARGLSAAGLDVDIATTDDNGPGRLHVPFGIPVHADDATYWFFRRQATFYTISLPLARWLCKNVCDYDLVHIHALFSWSSLFAAWLAARHRVPYVVRPLGTLSGWGLRHRRPVLKRLSLNLLDKRILTGAARIHYTSTQECRDAEELGIAGRAAIVPLGIDLRRLEGEPSRGWLERHAPHLTGRPILLFLSRIHPIKGLDLLLRSLARLKDEGLKLGLVVAGSGSTEFVASLRLEAGRLGVGEAVFWAGFLEGPEKLAALAASDVFVLPSYSESFGVAVVEAMACGLPVVVSDRVGIHDDVTAAAAGCVVSCRVEAFVDAIRRMVTEPQLRQRSGENGRSLARERFSLDAMTAGVTRMYGDVLNSGPPRIPKC